MTIRPTGTRTGPRENKTPINREIRAREVRLIGKEGNQIGIVSRDEALDIASRAGLDLVEISGATVPPVCKIMDFGKFLYEQKKQKAEARKKQHQVQLKEVKLRPGTEENDYQVKLGNIRRFLLEGNKAKVTLRYRGREMAHQDIGMEQLMRIEKDLEDMSIVEQRPKLEGRQMTMVIAPKRH